MYMDRDRVRAVFPFAALGAACVVAGGFVSAAIAPVPTEHGAWASAYLVLVAGVAQVALGIGQAALIPKLASRRIVAAQLAGWNLGNAAVLIGTLLDITALVDVGGVALFGVLASFALRSRDTKESHATPLIQEHRRQALLLYAFRGLLLLLLVSIPVGLVLERVHPA